MNTQPTLPSSSGNLLKLTKGPIFIAITFSEIRTLLRVPSVLVSCPDPFRKNREGVWQQCHTTVCPARSVQCAPMRLIFPVEVELYASSSGMLYFLSTMNKTKQKKSDCRVQLRHINCFVTILLQVGVQSSDRV